jgi:hypothetical protein
VCLLELYITYILTSTTVVIECISWLIKVTDNNDGRWKSEISQVPGSAPFLTVRLDRVLHFEF